MRGNETTARRHQGKTVDKRRTNIAHAPDIDIGPDQRRLWSLQAANDPAAPSEPETSRLIAYRRSKYTERASIRPTDQQRVLLSTTERSLAAEQNDLRLRHGDKHAVVELRCGIITPTDGLHTSRATWQLVERTATIVEQANLAQVCGEPAGLTRKIDEVLRLEYNSEPLCPRHPIICSIALIDDRGREATAAGNQIQCPIKLEVVYARH